MLTSETKTHEQKRLVVSNLKEEYAHFKSTVSEMEIRLPKFATVQPKNCFLAAASGTHCVHMYSTSECEANSDTYLCSYHHSLAITFCNLPVQNGFFSECMACLSPLKVKEILENIFEEKAIGTIMFILWLTAD
jgi:hypothetical protein